MNRLVIVTVGKTHSGKTTFAQALVGQLKSSIVIDQDNHASFINAHYRALRPLTGPNTLKYDVTQTIVNFAVNHSSHHLVLCNSNLARKGRTEILNYFRDNGFMSILVYFNIPHDVLQARVAKSQRSKEIFRFASTFEEVLARQLAGQRSEMSAPEADEADHFFVISRDEDVSAVIEKITGIAERM